MAHEYRQWRIQKNMPRRAAECGLNPAAMSIGTHDEQIGAGRVANVEDPLARIVDVGMPDLSGDIMLPEARAKRGPAAQAVPRGPSERDDANGSGAFQERQGVADRPSRFARPIPGDNRAIERDR